MKKKKVLLYCFLLFTCSTFISSCSGSGSKTTQLTQAQKDSIEKVKQDSLFQAEEQQRINDSIRTIEYREKQIAETNKLLNECEVTCFEDIASFNNNRNYIANAISSVEDTKLKNKWTKVLKSIQTRNYPKARKFYIQKMKKEMWINDVEVYGSGTTITFVSYMFASNSNIQTAYTSVKPGLENLRFKRVNFKWAEHNEYTYYTLDTPSDGTI